jgi:hypothetical protein
MIATAIRIIQQQVSSRLDPGIGVPNAGWSSSTIYEDQIKELLGECLDGCNIRSETATLTGFVGGGVAHWIGRIDIPARTWLWQDEQGFTTANPIVRQGLCDCAVPVLIVLNRDEPPCSPCKIQR